MIEGQEAYLMGNPEAAKQQMEMQIFYNERREKIEALIGEFVDKVRDRLLSNEVPEEAANFGVMLNSQVAVIDFARYLMARCGMPHTSPDDVATFFAACADHAMQDYDEQEKRRAQSN